MRNRIKKLIFRSFGRRSDNSRLRVGAQVSVRCKVLSKRASVWCRFCQRGRVFGIRNFVEENNFRFGDFVGIAGHLREKFCRRGRVFAWRILPKGRSIM